MTRKRQIEADLWLGNPELPSISPKTFVPGRDSVYITLLALSGQLGTPEEAWKSTVAAIQADDHFSHLAEGLDPENGRIESDLFLDNRSFI